MSDREMINEEDLEVVTGGTITNSYNKNTKTGTVSSNVTGQTFHYQAEFKAKIYNYLSSHRGDSDSSNMNYLKNQGWVY